LIDNYRKTAVKVLNTKGTNVIWVFHALTGNGDALDWWDGLIGDGLLFDPKKYFIVCANVLGSCYGSTCPSSINPITQKAYHKDFPLITIRDMIGKIYLGIGGSMGGQQLLEWAVMEPDVFEIIIPMATNARMSAWGIAFNESQRMALEADQTLYDIHPEAGYKGQVPINDTKA